MNKRDIVLSLVDRDTSSSFIPAGFFMHFDPSCHRGQAAIDKHMEYFNFTGMDFVKIQYENRFPVRQEISKPKDWAKMPCYGYDFYEDQISVAKGLVDRAGKDALVLMTLYSPFMCAGQSTSKTSLAEHLKENPDQTKKGIEIITESLMIFVKGCIDVGIDGFYHSTQGGETCRFEGTPVFDEIIKPTDLALMSEIENICKFNILHICDYEGGYSDLSAFLDYPGHVVNSSLRLNDKIVRIEKVAKMFGRPFMGGVDRHGIIFSGDQEDVKRMVIETCKNTPERFILGADCTIPSNTDWMNVQVAIETSHNISTYMDD